MHVYKVIVEVTDDHRIALRLPEDFPRGPADVIILASMDAEQTHQQIALVDRNTPVEKSPAVVLDAFARRFPMDPVLSQIVLQEDPSAPVNTADWPEDARP